MDVQIYLTWTAKSIHRANMSCMQDLLNTRMSSTDAAIALIKRGNTVLMGLREYKKGQPVWTYPGGRGEPGETVQEALVREVFEEIGITDLSIASYLGEKPGVKPGDRVYFFQSVTSQQPVLKEPEKFLEWRWINLGHLPNNNLI